MFWLVVDDGFWRCVMSTITIEQYLRMENVRKVLMTASFVSEGK